MLDLARLLEIAGRQAEARCTYLEIMRRWPHHSLRAEIDARVAALGEGTCPGPRG
jgi:hypothetical protein